MVENLRAIVCVFDVHIQKAALSLPRDIFSLTTSRDSCTFSEWPTESFTRLLYVRGDARLARRSGSGLFFLSLLERYRKRHVNLCAFSSRWITSSLNYPAFTKTRCHLSPCINMLKFHAMSLLSTFQLD